MMRIIKNEDKKDLFRKVWIKTKDDLPKVDGDYFMYTKTGYGAIHPFKTGTCRHLPWHGYYSKWWLRDVCWYLLPVSSLQSSEPKKRKTAEDILEKHLGFVTCHKKYSESVSQPEKITDEKLRDGLIK